MPNSFISFKKTTPILLKFFLFFATFFLFASQAHAANLSISPASGSQNVGSTFAARVMVSSAQQMNAAEASLSFNASHLAVVNITKGTAFNLWTTEPVFSNSAGTISFGGGSTSAFTGQQTLITVTFRVLSEGTGQVSFSSGTVTAHDGMGTNIRKGMAPASFQLVAGTTPEPTPPAPTPPPPGPSAATPASPSITSSTHPDPDKWYNLSDAEFDWNLPAGVNAVRLLIGRLENATPTVVHSPAISSRTIEDLEDGVWYFHVQLRNSAGFGRVGTMKIMIDTVPPENFEVVIQGEEGSARPLLAFEATDELSGISHYEVIIGDREPIRVTPEDMSSGAYQVQDVISQGTHTVTVRAYDMAGNYTDAETELVVLEDFSVPAVIDGGEDLSFLARFGSMILTILLLMAIAGLSGYSVYLKKKFQAKMDQAESEAKEIRTKMEKIFSVLRDESREIVSKLNEQPRLNAKEKKAVEKFKDALDISEELISKEIEDVEKLLR
jgi:hypothetical protein